MKRPLLNTFHFFHVAARTGSFVKAAAELHVTHGAVSRQIKLLEENLAVKLFERRNRSVFLTQQGKLLQTTLSRVFGQLDKTLAQIQQPVQNTPLVVACESTLLMRWLIPRLRHFYRRYPEIQLQLVGAQCRIEFQKEGIDVVLCRDDFYYDNTTYSEVLSQEWITPVCLPCLLKDQKLDLNAHRILHSHAKKGAWENWCAVTHSEFNCDAEQTYEHCYLTLQAAATGLGVAMGSALMVQKELASQQLSAPFDFVRDGSSYVLLSMIPFSEDSRRQTFMRWLKAQMKQSLRELGLS